MIINPERFVDGLGHVLSKSGLPLLRLQIAFRTLHPQAAACAFTWSPGQKSVEFCLLHEDRISGSLHDPELEELVDGPGTTAVVAPLISSSGNNNVISMVTTSSNGFSNSDTVKINALAWLLSPVVEVIAAQRITRVLLDTYIGHRAGEKVLRGLIKRGDGETIEAAIWYSDMRGFTGLSEVLAPEELISTLNSYFEYVTEAIKPHGGEVLRFIGDAILIIFPVRKDGDSSNSCQSALIAATGALDQLEKFNGIRKKQGKIPILFGIGLHVGRLIYGNVGTVDRLEFTVIGMAVNQAERIERLTKKLGVSLLISCEFANNITGGVKSIGAFQLQGINQMQELFTNE